MTREADVQDLGAPAPRLVYDEARSVALVLRPRLVFVVLCMVLPVVGTALMLKLSYDDASFDPRIAIFAVYAVVGPLAAVRARLVVSGGALWKRGAGRRYTGIELEQLASVEVRRSRLLKQEGWVRTIAVVTDRRGRRVSFKPALWSRGASELLAGLATVARSQGLELDATTATRLARASAATPNVASGWSSPVVSLETAPRSSLWWRVDEQGKATGRQRRVLLAVVAMVVVMIPGMLTLGGRGTKAIRSLRCSNDRHLWTDASIVPTPSVLAAPDVLAQRLSAGAVHVGTIRGYTLAPTNLANEHNTAAVQRDALRLVPGSEVVTWSDDTGHTTAEVFIELFDSEASALAFQRDYAEDHCHIGDLAFATPSIPGGVGFRCRCSGEVSDDRVSFVRGSTRIQAIEWGISERDGHGAAIDLASRSLALMEG